MNTPATATTRLPVWPAAKAAGGACTAGVGPVSAEINLGTKTVLEYLLSPVRNAWHKAGRER